MIVNVLLGLLVPIAWGLLSAYAYDRLSQRQARRAASCSSPERDPAPGEPVR